MLACSVQPRAVVGVPVADGDSMKTCPICDEQFNVVHSNEEDCWVYEGTVRPTEGQPHAGEIVHRDCYLDATLTSPMSPLSPADTDDGHANKRMRREP